MKELLNIDAVLSNADWPKKTDDRLATLGVAKAEKKAEKKADEPKTEPTKK